MARGKIESETGGKSRQVKISTLGRFVVEIDGAPLRFGAKAQRKPLELLKVIIALGGESVSIEILIEALWPESEGDRAYNAFGTTLNRLRTLIGRDSLHLQDGRLTLDPHYCRVDSQEFMGLMALAAQAVKAGDGTAAWGHLEEALALYRGSFLEGDYDPPEILSARDKLHSLFLRHVEGLGHFLEQNGQPEKAISLYQKGLELDDLAEDFYRHLMQCYRQQGRLAEALAVYQRCRQILHAKMEVEPSPETENVYQSLLTDQVRILSTQETIEEIHTRAPAQDEERPAQPEPTKPSGERRRATVVFSNLSGYTAMNDQLDPERWIR